MANEARMNDGKIIDAQARGLEEASAEELKLYRQLAGLVDRQAEAVDRGDTEQLMKVVGVKQSVLEQIEALQQTTGPAKADSGAPRPAPKS
jgi:flagellar biosynthesis/type III secretory pathway chaperone